jgi:pyruvate formate lyase activating enzyme
MENGRGYIFDIRRFSIHDGPGIRTTVFFKGCPLRCLWCHNPESQSTYPELILHPRRCTLCGACLEICPHDAIYQVGQQMLTDRAKCQLCQACVQVCFAEARQFTGREMTVEQVMAEVERDGPFYDQSGGGVTFSGGEPLFQVDFLRTLLQACKRHEIHTALDTCGFAPFETFESLRSWVDLFLFDLKHMDDAIHYELTGVSNRLILDNLQGLSRLGHTIYLRVPLIPGANDDDNHLRLLARFVSGLPNLERVSLLPYHAGGLEKSTRLNKTVQTAALLPIPESRLSEIKTLFQAYGLETTIGG